MLRAFAGDAKDRHSRRCRMHLFKRRLAINWFVETEMCANEVFASVANCIFLSVVSGSFCHRVLIAMISWIRVHTVECVCAVRSCYGIGISHTLGLA